MRWVDFQLLIFGALFIAIVLLLPGGLVQASQRVRHVFARGRALVAKTKPSRTIDATRANS